MLRFAFRRRDDAQEAEIADGADEARLHPPLVLGRVLQLGLGRLALTLALALGR